VCLLEKELVELQYQLSQTQKSLEIAISRSKNEIDILRQKINTLSTELAASDTKAVNDSTLEPFHKQSAAPFIEPEVEEKKKEPFEFENTPKPKLEVDYEEDVVDSKTIKKPL
jgi:DNA anti-recombination protein RmuC